MLVYEKTLKPMKRNHSKTIAYAGSAEGDCNARKNNVEHNSTRRRKEAARRLQRGSVHEKVRPMILMIAAE